MKRPSATAGAAVDCRLIELLLRPSKGAKSMTLVSREVANL